MTVLMQILAWLAACGCLLFALHLLASRSPNRTPARILGVNFLVFAVQSALLGMLFRGSIWPAVIVRPTLAMTIGPLLLLYFASAADPRFRLEPRHLWHLAPAALVGAELATNVYPVDIDLAIFASFAAYAAALGVRAARGPDQFRHLGEGGTNAFRLLVAASALLAISFVAEIGIYLDVTAGAPLSRSPALLATLAVELAIVAVAIVAALGRPSPFDWMYAFGTAGRTAAEPSDEDFSRVAAFGRLVTSERVHLEEGASLRSIARALDLPARRLSEAINKVHGESFSRHMNRLRVEEAKRLLREAPDMPMFDVMYEAGFRTKSSFNKEFRAIAGTSPSHYRATG